MNKNHPNNQDLKECIDWCLNVLKKNKDFVILDTETTGLGNSDEIIEMAIITPTGECLLNERFLPSCSVGKSATSVHGITKKDLLNCQTFSEASPKIEQAIGKKKIITYNSKFDARLYAQTMKNERNGFVPKGEWLCAMEVYSQFIGDINQNTGEYKWQKLQGGDHTALGDCLATLDLIKGMSTTKQSWKFW